MHKSMTDKEICQLSGRTKSNEVKDTEEAKCEETLHQSMNIREMRETNKNENDDRGRRRTHSAIWNCSNKQFLPPFSLFTTHSPEICLGFHLAPWIHISAIRLYPLRRHLDLFLLNSIQSMIGWNTKFTRFYHSPTTYRIVCRCLQHFRNHSLNIFFPFCTNIIPTHSVTNS